MDVSQALDSALAAQEVNQSDLIRRKLDMDALKRRLGDTASKQEKLRESCEGFESIFLQKMWEQMRKTVPKEGYLHSKDEEMYQSLFDIELCKKMTSAGGIGLADMLYAQLSRQLEDSGRTTSPGNYRNPLNIEPSSTLLPAAPLAAANGGLSVRGGAADKKLTAEDLYTPLAPEESVAEGFFPGEGVPEKALQDTSLAGTLRELRAELDGASPGPGAVEEWAEARAAATGAPFLSPASVPPSAPASRQVASDFSGEGAKISATVRTDLPPAGQNAAAQVFSGGAMPPSVPGAATEAEGRNAVAGAAAGRGWPVRESSPRPAASPAPGIKTEERSARTSAASNPALASWQGPGPVSAQPRPAPLFSRGKKSASARQAETEKKAPVQPRGMVPQETLWPLSGRENSVVSRFGWEDSPAGKRQWNSGVRIAAAPGAPVRAVLPGTVVYAGPRDGFGNTVVLEHKDGYRSYYSHVDSPSVQVGEKVKHGAEFARVATQPFPGAQGENSASLHFELKKGEMALNPESAIRRQETADG